MTPQAQRKQVDGRPTTSSIGQVIDLLRPEFPDVTISKVRFLENEGLVTPERTASGYRRFAETDIDRLRFILAAQRDRYLPLKVIRAELEELDAGVADGTAAALPLGRRPEGLPGAEPMDFRPSQATRLSTEMVAAQAEVSVELVKELHSTGLIEPGRGGYFEAESVIIAKTAKELVEHGVELRHLRAFRTAATRQADVIASLAGPVAGRNDPDARDRAAELAREIAALSVTLQSTLVTVKVRRELDR